MPDRGKRLHLAIFEEKYEYSQISILFQLVGLSRPGFDSHNKIPKLKQGEGFWYLVREM
jgi:hypothetical protein